MTVTTSDRGAAACQSAGRRLRASRWGDGWAVAGLLALTIAVQAPLLLGGTALALDGITQFVQWYAWLGQQLRAGALPGWNPHVFSGMPFAGAALSGWGYLPAMLLYTLLPVHLATAGYLLVTLALAGTGMYVLARALGMPLGGALMAAITYEFSGYLLLQNPCCFAFAGVEAWLPWTLLGAELAIRGEGYRARLRGWILSGLALSQVLAAWLGQGSMYVLLALGAWLVWRTVISPPAPREALKSRVGRLALHATAVLALGALLGAAGILPRLELNAVSNLAGGYPVQANGEVTAIGGWRAGDFAQLLKPGAWYAGVVPLALALAAPVVARRRYATPFFALLAAAAAVLSMARRTPLHDLLLALPLADRLHPNHPERALLLFYPAVALLAGATTSAILAGAVRIRAAVWPVAVVIGLVAGDLLLGFGAGVAHLRAAPDALRLVDVDLRRYFAQGPVVDWLREAGAGNGTGRYFGYAPHLSEGRLRPTAYSVRWADPQVTALLVNNQAMAAGLADVQGYDPVHIARYDDLIYALNDRGQNYHFADIRPTGVFSPLLDMLNVRWFLVPSQRARVSASSTLSDDPRDVARISELAARLPTVYDDGTVRILARPTALPRAWLVHDARRELPGRALPLLASGAVDPATTALLEVNPPPLGIPTDEDRDTALVRAHSRERMVVDTTSDADALLVLSEIAYPAWRATVDGRPAELLIANHALRAVPVPAGTHAVELRFASPALTVGTLVTALTALGLIVIVVRSDRRTAPLSCGLLNFVASLPQAPQAGAPDQHEQRRPLPSLADSAPSDEFQPDPRSE